MPGHLADPLICCFPASLLYYTPMLPLILALIALAFAVALPATFLARAFGRRLSALDGAGVPGQVKAPPRRVPNIGGIGIFAGVALPMLAALALTALNAWGPIAANIPSLTNHLPGLRDMLPRAAVLLACITALHILGLIDDRRPLGARPKLLIMLALAAAAVIGTDSRLLTLLDSHVGGPWLSIALTVLWVVIITNAFNFLDNMDGLSAGVAAIAAAAFLTTALLASPPQWFIAAMLALILGASLGFLVFNFPFRARRTDPDGLTTGGASIFMGDGGSLIIGFLLAILSVRLTYTSATPHASLPAPHSLLIPLVILAIPLYDFCSVVIIRLRQGKSPFVGDLQHFSHRLCKHGLTPRAAVLTIYGCTLITAIGAIAMPRLEPWQGALIGVQTLLVLAVLAGYEWARTP